MTAITGNSDNPRDCKFKKGDFVIGIESADKYYRKSRKDVMCYVVDNKFWETPFHTKQSDMRIICLRDDMPSATPLAVYSKHFRYATKAEVDARILTVREIRASLDSIGTYKTGDPIVLTQDLVFPQKQGMFVCGEMTIRKGTPAIIDLAPGEPVESTALASDSSAKKRKRIVEVEDFNVPETGFKLRDFVAPRICVYFPDLESEEFVPPTAIKKREAQHENIKLVVPDDYMTRIITATKRVTDRSVHDFVYEKLGLYKVCQKGRGAIILLYGPPGSGKTMTAEVLAECIGRPLIKLTLPSITNAEGLITRLKSGFERASRYKAILLLDEVDVFIRKRGGMNPVFDENTSVFLRVLEYYDGIMIMTSNLVGMIDDAVFSRVHVCLEYGVTDHNERREIWKGMLTDEIISKITGRDEDHNAMLDTLAEIPINGREIKTVIQNAVCRAVANLNNRNTEDPAQLPTDTIRWIPRNYFIEEAKLLHEQRTSLRREA